MACCVADDRPGQRRSWTTTSSSTRWRRDSDRVGTAFRVYSLQASPDLRDACPDDGDGSSLAVNFLSQPGCSSSHLYRLSYRYGLCRASCSHVLSTTSCLPWTVKNTCIQRPSRPLLRRTSMQVRRPAQCSPRDTRLGGRSRIKPTNNRTAEMADAQRTSLRSSGFC